MVGVIEFNTLGRGNIRAGFELLLEALDQTIGSGERAAEEAKQRREYGNLSEIYESLEASVEARERVRAGFRRLFGQIMIVPSTNKTQEKRRRVANKLRRGIKTPSHRFYKPILETVQQHGGRVSSYEVWPELERKIAGILREVDRQPTEAGVRWHATVHAAVAELKKTRLMREGLKKGIWEITEQGIEWLRIN
jgi:hypothetical protein